MSTAPEWFDPVTGQPLPADDGELSPEQLAERAERAARADAAVTAARAARASLSSSAAGLAGAAAGAGPAEALLAPSPPPELAVPPQLEVTPETAASPAARSADEPYSALRLSSGIVGRVVLAFVIGCLAISLLPLVIGWHPYVVKSGSMEPRIKVGDIVLASPEPGPQSPARPRHRVHRPGPARPDQEPPGDRGQPGRHDDDQGRRKPDRRPGPRRAEPGAWHRPAAGPLGRPAAGLGDDRPVPLPRPLPARAARRRDRGGQRPRGRRGRRTTGRRPTTRTRETDDRADAARPGRAGQRLGTRTANRRARQPGGAGPGWPGPRSAWSAPAHCWCPGTSAAFSATTKTTGAGLDRAGVQLPGRGDVVRALPVLEARRGDRDGHGRRRLGQRPHRQLRRHLHPRRDRRHAGHHAQHGRDRNDQHRLHQHHVDDRDRRTQRASPRSSGSRPRPATPAAAS